MLGQTYLKATKIDKKKQFYDTEMKKKTNNGI